MTKPIKNLPYRILKFSLSILFWFFVVLISFCSILTYHFADFDLTERGWWDDFYGTSSSLLAGALISFLFYFLVVYIPERRQRIIIKDNFKALYKQIKEDILYEIIFASQKGGRKDIQANNETVEKLMTIEGFRLAFEGGRESDEGFYAFRNYISDDVPEFREIILHLKTLSKQIDYILHKYPLTDSKVFAFFKRLEIFLIGIEVKGPGYEEEKALSSFIWEIFAGQNFISGDLGYDVVEEMIEKI